MALLNASIARDISTFLPPEDIFAIRKLCPQTRQLFNFDHVDNIFDIFHIARHNQVIGTGLFEAWLSSRKITDVEMIDVIGLAVETRNENMKARQIQLVRQCVNHALASPLKNILTEYFNLVCDIEYTPHGPRGRFSSNGDHPILRMLREYPRNLLGDMYSIAIVVCLSQVPVIDVLYFTLERLINENECDFYFIRNFGYNCGLRECKSIRVQDSGIGAWMQPPLGR